MKVEVLTMIGNTMQTIQFMFAGHSCVEFRANAFGVAAYQQWEDYKGANLCTLLVIEVENVVLPERLPMKKEPETYTASLHFVGEEIQAALTSEEIHVNIP